MDKIADSIAKSRNIDPRVVAQIVHHPFRFLRDVITSTDDDISVRFRYFGVFTIKKGLSKYKKYKKITEYVLRVYKHIGEPYTKEYEHTYDELSTLFDGYLIEKNYALIDYWSVKYRIHYKNYYDLKKL